MYTEKTTNLRNFEQAGTDGLVHELFYLFERSGRWFKSLEEMCQNLLLSEAEREATHREWLSTSEEEHQAALEAAIAQMGNFSWLRHGCEFGLWKHTRIDRNEVTIHAFALGYGESGKSDDPLLYVIHRPGDEDDFDKVYIVHRKIVPYPGINREIWVKEPIRAKYEQYVLHSRMENCG
ncbi:MAG: hypothetical protein MUF19_02425 [Candidatus Pacebacteria bacterium]|jgi:hypothetical protein|nr:hypothetical protein [Candidatus Paceibacterota bacterium]